MKLKILLDALFILLCEASVLKLQKLPLLISSLVNSNRYPNTTSGEAAVQTEVLANLFDENPRHLEEMSTVSAKKRDKIN